MRLALSKSAIANSIRRLRALDLVKDDEAGSRRVDKLALRDCLGHAVRWIAPARVGNFELGLPTAHAADGLDAKLVGDEDPVRVTTTRGRGRRLSQMLKIQSVVDDPECGAAFQTYFDCAAAQEKCTSAGITDDSATTAAIGAHCAAEASAYKACVGTTTVPTAPACGSNGAACGTTGAPCASTNCCDPATGKCRGQGEACGAAGTVCASGQCGRCGAPGEPCCSIFGMTQPNGCPGGGCCNYALGMAGGSCIAEGGQCEAPGPMTVETVCHTGSCVTCGSSFGMCCSGNKCTDAKTVCSPSTAMCMPCGASGQPACP